MLKKITVWLLLLAYLHASAQMVLPLVQDCVAHLLFWHEHMEHVHHGHHHSNHVDHEMQQVLHGHDDNHHDSTPENLPSSNYWGKYILSSHILGTQTDFLLPKTHDIFLTSRIIRYNFFLKPVEGQPLTPPPELEKKGSDHSRFSSCLLPFLV